MFPVKQLKCSGLQYYINPDIYLLDYSGLVTLGTGMTNIELIKKQIENISTAKTSIKILFDIRHTIWENRETHNCLSSKARHIFNNIKPDMVIYTAILNNELEGRAFDNEYWFIRIKDAIKWLESIK